MVDKIGNSPYPSHTGINTHGKQGRHIRNLSGMSNVSYDSIDQSPQKKKYIEVDQADSASCFMGVLDCLLAPFKHVIDFIMWVICCCPNPVDRFIANPEKTSKELVRDPLNFAIDIVDAISTKLPQIAASLKSSREMKEAAKKAESRIHNNLRIGLSKLIFAGTGYEEMYIDFEYMSPKDFTQKYADKPGKFDEFAKGVSDYSIKIHPQYIFWQLYLQTGHLIREDSSVKSIIHSMKLSEENPLQLMGALKENQAFRKLVLEQVLQKYMREHLTIEEKKYPVLADLINRINLLLKDEIQADRWVKQFLEAIITIYPEEPISQLSSECFLSPVEEGEFEDGD